MSRSLFWSLALFAAGSLALASAPPPAAPKYRLSGPHSHDNLSVWFLHGTGPLDGKKVLTLDEAMAAKKVVVHETKNVQQLAIENLGEEEVFLQAGDIVKGGQQDRTIAIDLLLPGKSGKVPLPSFCVERGRWAGRGGENVVMFSSSRHALTDNRLKYACRVSKDQSKVWMEVTKAQKDLNKAVKGEVRAAASATSLQLTLENKKVQEAIETMVKKLESSLGDQKDVIGFVVAINGKVNNADVFASAGLFRKMWPKLLRASAVEAVTGKKEGAKVETVKVEAVERFLADAWSGKSSEAKTVCEQVEMVKEAKDNVLIETRARGGALLRCSYLAK